VQRLTPDSGHNHRLQSCLGWHEQYRDLWLHWILPDGDYPLACWPTAFSNGTNNMAGDYLLNFFFLNATSSRPVRHHQ